jgi:hypothetical protein
MVYPKIWETIGSYLVRKIIAQQIIEKFPLVEWNEIRSEKFVVLYVQKDSEKISQKYEKSMIFFS